MCQNIKLLEILMPRLKSMVTAYLSTNSDFVFMSVCVAGFHVPDGCYRTLCPIISYSDAHYSIAIPPSGVWTDILFGLDLC